MSTWCFSWLNMWLTLLVFIKDIWSIFLYLKCLGRKKSKFFRFDPTLSDWRQNDCQFPHQRKVFFYLFLLKDNKNFVFLIITWYILKKEILLLEYIFFYLMILIKNFTYLLDLLLLHPPHLHLNFFMSNFWR